MECLIGLDIGTSAVKGVALSSDGKILASKTQEFTYFGKDENERLINAEDFVDRCFTAIKELANTVNNEYHISAISFCHASGNTLLLVENNKPLIPIIGWQTAIAREDLDEFYTAEEIKELYKIIGWPVGTHFSTATIPAIKKYRPDIIEKTATVTMAGEYLNFCLTGKWGISHSMATPFFLADQEKGEYHKPLLEKLGIADKFFPPIYDKGTVLGAVLPEIAEKLGLSEDTKIVLGTFDHPSGAMGAGVFEEGEMLLSCGTSWVEFFPVSTRERAISVGALVDRFMLDGNRYCVMKSLSSISVKINKLRKDLLGEISHKEFDVLSEQAPKGSNGLRFYFDDGDIELAKGRTKGEIARAITESAALMLNEELEKLRELGLKADRVTMIGGITNSSVCVKIVSDILGVPITVVNGQAAGAVGAALLAGIGVGLYKDEKDAYKKADFTEMYYG